MNAPLQKGIQFTATRDDIFREYAAEKRDFVSSTRPYVSVQTVIFDIVDAIPAGGAVMAHAVMRAKQELEWFSFGVGDILQIGSTSIVITKKATEADTNLSKGKKTNGIEDFVIEGVSSSVQGMRIVYADADVPAGVVDGDVKAAYKGGVKLVDPAALVAPPQFGSPLNLEDVFYEAVASKISARFVWDRKGFIPIGTLDQFPEGAARSIIRAHGHPATDNRYKIPEGYLFARVDKTDGDFSMVGKTEDPVVIPITLIALSGADTPLVVPTMIALDIRVRLHGLGFRKPGRNS